MKEYNDILFPYAYNILGSVEDARDTVQEVIFRYSAKKVVPDNEKNYLIKGVVNEAINQKKRNGRVQSIDNWLPEPVAMEQSDKLIELKDLVSYSILILLEKLNPKERAVFILKEGFSYTHQEIADVLGVSVEASRKLLSRANEKLSKPKHQQTKPDEAFDVLEIFVEAIQQKDLEKLHTLLSDDINYVADGGRVRVLKKLCTGIEEVGHHLLKIYHTYQRKTVTRPTIVNHQPAILYFYRDKAVACQVFEFNEEGEITGILNIVDPEKLKNL